MLRRAAVRLARRLQMSSRAAARPHESLCPRAATALAAADAAAPWPPAAAAQSQSGWQLAVIGLLGLAGSMCSSRAEEELPPPPDQDKVRHEPALLNSTLTASKVLPVPIRGRASTS